MEIEEEEGEEAKWPEVDDASQAELKVSLNEPAEERRDEATSRQGRRREKRERGGGGGITGRIEGTLE